MRLKRRWWCGLNFSLLIFQRVSPETDQLPNRAERGLAQRSFLLVLCSSLPNLGRRGMALGGTD